VVPRYSYIPINWLALVEIGGLYSAALAAPTIRMRGLRLLVSLLVPHRSIISYH
jgi:hypothetical protein